MAVLAPDGTTVTFTVTEPTKNTDGSVLTDLAKVRMVWRLQNGKDTPQNALELPASAPAGGGQVVFSVKVPILPCEAADVVGSAWVENARGGASAATPQSVLRIDRMSECVRTPSAPSSLVIA